MENHQIKILLVGVILLLSSCVKDELHRTAHPAQGAVQVTTDWTGHSAEATLPAHYTLRIGTTEKEVSGTVNCWDDLLQPDSYNLLAYNTPAGITVSGNTATVSSLPDGTLEPLPDYLFSAVKQLAVIADDRLEVTLPMKQRIRRLTLILKLNAGDEARIARTTATLTGIAPSIDLATEAVTATEGKTVIPLFTLTAAPATKRSGTRAATDAARLEATVRLLNVMATEQQLLTLFVTLNDGSVHPITTNLTALLKNYTDGSKEPLALDAYLVLPVAAGISADITDWTVVENGDIDIH